MKTRYQFIHFENEGENWFCSNNKTNELLGTVEFYERWRQWIFAPTGPSIYSIGCLNDISHFMSQLSKPCLKEQTVLPF